MMKLKKIYLDSCCFIEVANDQKGVTSAHGARFVLNIRAILRAAKAGDVEVHCSMLSVVECLRTEDETRPAISSETQELFRGILTSGNSGVIPRSADYFVTERARDLRWRHQINLRPADAIHVATAIEQGCDEFWTMDGVNGKTGSILSKAAQLKAIGLHVIAPDQTSCIPDKYKQMQLKDDRRPHEKTAKPNAAAPVIRLGGTGRRLTLRPRNAPAPEGQASEETGDEEGAGEGL